ncbi:MAG: imidazolonepropionase, partial [Anaerolineae bacterium]|nr:imidazolonepropionase [Anaerolineae bacterium]
MSAPVDLLIHSAEQVATCASPGGPKRGPALANAGIFEYGAIAVSDGLIVAVGPSDDLRARYHAAHEIDATGQAVCPGFVDPHTHVIYAGDRLGEFEMRIRGASYMEIMRAGGGIASTVRATRNAPLESLVEETRARLVAMFRLGTTTAEVKTGYGLETASEMQMLKAAAILDAEGPVELVPSFIGAHATPPEYHGRVDEYVDLVIDEMIPTTAAWYLGSRFKERGVPFCVDAFCEQNVFDLTQTRCVL